MTAPIRVLVVDDSATFRHHLVELVSRDSRFEVVGVAASGDEAIEMCRRLRPDVMSLDLLLPAVNGLGVTEQVMAHTPTPILVVSGQLGEDQRFAACEALAAGAVEVLAKPDAQTPLGAWDARFLTLLKLVSRIRVIRHIRGREAVARTASLPVRLRAPAQPSYSVVALGASTGGPTALLTILRDLPRDFPLPILVVLHLGGVVGATFAEWLSSHSSLPVRTASDDEPLPPVGLGQVIVAPPDQHMLVRDGRLRLTQQPARNACRPSVDVLFESIAREVGSAAIGCLLTGMGCDGAAGLLAMRQAGGATFVQDERSSVVFGMPREAIRLGAATEVLPLERVASVLSGLASAGATLRQTP